MKKSTVILCLSAMAAFSSISSQAADTPAFVWGNIFDSATTAGDQNQGVSVAPDGSVYWHNLGGSTESAPDISYAGEVLFQGVPYNAGTSYNNNLCIMKTDNEGKLLWDLHSLSCDCATNDGRIVATPDGGAVFTVRVRHTDGMLDTPLSIVDGTGTRHDFNWTVDRRYYRGMICAVDADGALLWTRFIDLDTTPAPSASGNNAEFTADAFTIPGLALDDEGNLYLSGNFRKDMHLLSKDGEVTLPARNVSTWTGDSQETVGGLYLLKLDAEGYYLSNLEVSGDSSSETIRALCWNDGALYFEGLFYGKGSEISVGGVSFTPEGDFSPVVARLDSELDVKWLDAFKGEKVGGKYGFQNCSLTVCGDNLWYTGMFNGSLTDPDGNPFVTSTQGNMREGFLGKIGAETGKCIKGVGSRESFSGNVLTGYLSAVQNPFSPSKVYVFGYGMNATVGVFLRSYDSVTLEADPEEAWTLASQGGVPTAIACAYDIDNRSFYFTGRGNKPFVCSGETVGDNSTWAVLMARYDLPEADFPTSVAETVFGDSNVKIKAEAVDGGLSLSSIEPLTVGIYNAAGVMIRKVDVDGSVRIALPSGLYIVAGSKLIVR